MKKTVALMLLIALSASLAFAAGCGKDSGAGTNGTADGGVDSAQYDRGFSAGQKKGYEKGYADGKAGVYEPGTVVEEDDGDYYSMGFHQGWIEGYEEGYEEGSREINDSAEEMAEVQEAMLAFVKQNSAPGMEFRIENIVIHGDQAAGVAVCTSEVLESPLVVMKKGASGWSGVDFGTGIEPPAWYTP